MNISELFIRRPIMTTLVMLAILVFGIAAYRLLPVSDLPNVDYPTIQVSASLPGASPETMASAVATPLERQFSTIAGLDSMTSTNALGSTRITLQFNLSRDIDAAGQDVQAMIAKAGRQLPQNMPTPPTYTKVNPADQPVLYLALSSPTLPISAVYEYADTFIAQRISMISGVAQVQVFGSQKFAVRAQLDPRALANRKIGINEVGSALAMGNVNLPTGTLQGEKQAFTIQATGQLYNAASYRPLIVAYRGGSPVRLEELGRVIDSVENDKSANWYRNERGVVLAINRQPGTNTVEVVDSIKEAPPGLQGPDTSFGQSGNPVRPVCIHPRIGPGCEVHPFSRLMSGSARYFSFPAEYFRYYYPESCASLLHCRHLCRDVSDGIQREQYLPYGADSFRRICGG